MTETVDLKNISRRKSLSLIGFYTAMGLAAPATVLSPFKAEAQTVGLERRQDRREGRRERREVRRDARLDRREGRYEARETRRAARRGY